jgi:hypothetical protein
MKYRVFTLLVFLALPAVCAAPRTFVSTCDVQIQIRDGRDAEGSPIPGQRAEFILPCITKRELARIIEDLGKGDAERKDRALDALTRAEQIRLVLTQAPATQEKD